MNATSAAIGLDIGGTKAALAVVEGTGRILARTTLPTEAELGFDRAVDRLAAAIDELLRRTALPRTGLAGIGIACAGPVDPARGLINNPYTLAGWDHCDIVSPLRDRFDVPVRLENDADAAALGESVHGAGQGADPLVMLTFGTGVGGAAIVRGAIYRGAGGEHPELGHIPVLPDGTACYCGIRGCLESLASGTAIERGAREADLACTSARDVFTAAISGNAVARAIVDRATSAAATGAWTLCHTFLPERLILGGGVMDDQFPLFAAAIQRRLATATQFTPSNVAVTRAALGNDAGLVGASGLVHCESDPGAPWGEKMTRRVTDPSCREGHHP